MKVNKSNEDLIITPETAFEREWLQEFCPLGASLKAFRKTGLSVGDFMGIKVIRHKEPASETSV